MMRKSKILTILLMIVLLLTLVAGTVNAASAGVILTSNSKLKAGETVTVDINLSALEAEGGISGIQAKVNYDKDVFETLTTSSFTSANGWTAKYSDNSGILTGLKDTKVTSPEKIFTITLKVKSDITVNSATITLEDIKVSGGAENAGGTGNISANNASVTLKAEEVTVQPAAEPAVKPTTTQGATQADKTQSTLKSLPKTGVERTGAIIAVVAIIAGVNYILYKKLRDVK